MVINAAHNLKPADLTPIVTYDPNSLPPHTKRRSPLGALNIGLISANKYDCDK